MNSYAHLTSVTQTDTTSTCNNIADKHAPDRICFKKDDCRSRMSTESNSPSALVKTREFYDVLDSDAKFHSNELDEDVNLPHQSGPMLVETLNRFGLPSAYDSSSRWMYGERLIGHCLETQQIPKMFAYFSTCAGSTKTSKALLRKKPTEGMRRLSPLQ